MAKLVDLGVVASVSKERFDEALERYKLNGYVEYLPPKLCTNGQWICPIVKYE